MINEARWTAIFTVWMKQRNGELQLRLCLPAAEPASGRKMRGLQK